MERGCFTAKSIMILERLLSLYLAKMISILDPVWPNMYLSFINYNLLRKTKKDHSSISIPNTKSITISICTKHPIQHFLNSTTYVLDIDPSLLRYKG